MVQPVSMKWFQGQFRGRRRRLRLPVWMIRPATARLTPEAIDQVWLRLRAGQAAKPTARELGWVCHPFVQQTLASKLGGIFAVDSNMGV